MTLYVLTILSIPRDFRDNYPDRLNQFVLSFFNSVGNLPINKQQFAEFVYRQLALARSSYFNLITVKNENFVSAAGDILVISAIPLGDININNPLIQVIAEDFVKLSFVYGCGYVTL